MGNKTKEAGEQPILKLIYHKIADTGNVDKPPYIFRKWALCFWIPIVILTYVLAIAGKHCPAVPDLFANTTSISNAGAIEALYVNAGILGTMLVVTLGVTLIGLQLRTQSYTFGGMMDYVNDKVVYGFISIFMVNLMMSIMAATNVLFSEPRDYIPFAVIGTFFSLCYHIAYIYHVTYKLQPTQILNDAYKKMQDPCIKPACTMPEGMIDTHPRIKDRDTKKSYYFNRGPFEIWKDVMKKAVDTDDRPVFEEGFIRIISLKKDEKYPGSIDPKDISLLYITEVMTYCIEKNRRRLEEIFIESVENTYVNETSLYSHIKGWDIAIYEILDHSMRNAVDNDDKGMFKKSFDAIMMIVRVILKDQEKKGIEILRYINANNYDMVQACVRQNRHRLERILILRITKHDLLLESEKSSSVIEMWRIGRAEELSKMIENAIYRKDYEIFDNAMRSMVHILQLDLKARDGSSLSNFAIYYIEIAIQLCISHDQYRMLDHFIQIVIPTDIQQNESNPKIIESLLPIALQIIKNTMQRAVNNNDEKEFANKIETMMKIFNSGLDGTYRNDHVDMIVESISDVMKYCITHSRHRFEKIFLKKLYTDDKLITYDNPRMKKWQIVILEILDDMTTSAINNNDNEVFIDAFGATASILRNILKKHKIHEKKDLVDGMIIRISETMQQCIDGNHHAMVNVFINEIIQNDLLIARHHDEMIGKWRNAMLNVIKQIMSKSITSDNQMVFGKCIITIIEALKIILKKSPDDEKPHSVTHIALYVGDVMKTCVKYDHYGLQRTFMESIVEENLLLSEFKENNVEEVWRKKMHEILAHVMSHAAINNDADMFEHSIATVTTMLKISLKKSDENIRDHMVNFVTTDLEEIMNSCIRLNNRNTQRSFIKMITVNELMIKSHDQDIINWRRMASEIILKITRNTIEKNDQITFHYCIIAVTNLIRIIMNNCWEVERIPLVLYISKHISSTITAAISHRRYDLLSELVTYMKTDTLMLGQEYLVDIHWEKMIWKELVAITRHSIKNNVGYLFRNSIDAIFGIYEKKFTFRSGEAYSKMTFIRNINQIIKKCNDYNKEDFADYVREKKRLQGIDEVA